MTRHCVLGERFNARGRVAEFALMAKWNDDLRAGKLDPDKYVRMMRMCGAFKTKPNVTRLEAIGVDLSWDRLNLMPAGEQWGVVARGRRT